MHDYDSRLELAPRDIVTRAIVSEQMKGNTIYLDIRHLGVEFILKRFPNISKELKKRGFDLTKDFIPVTPAAHYSCGGVQVDLMGRTSVSNLFAFGEVACTGVHGANRLASNSLLEAVVFPLRLKETIFKMISWGPATPFAVLRVNAYFGLGFTLRSLRRRAPRPRVTPSKFREKIQTLMWENVGIVRKTDELKQALYQLSKWEDELNLIKGVSRELEELKNMVLVGKLITSSALSRPKSLGAHYRI